MTVSPESKEENEPTTPKKNRTLSEWFEDQRTSLTSKEERKKNKGENILRAM
ncbi:hypothetical protein J5751_05615 [bacterium]|nr:hypothetical protein [bacterium]